MKESEARRSAQSARQVRLEERYGSIGLPALKAALDAGRRGPAPESKQMSASLPEKWRDTEAQS
jgi:hypothetical protein